MPYDDNSKKLYVDTSVTPNKGISLNDIAECLQDYRVNTNGARDLGMLCTSPNIDGNLLWNKSKPFVVANGVNVYGVQDEAARRLAAYGFYWWNYIQESEAPFATSASECLTKAIANEGKWAYKRPTNIFRVQDFDGFTRYAKAPYAYSATSPNLGQTTYIGITHDAADTDIQITMSDMPDFIGEWEGSVADLNLAIIYRMKGTSTIHVEFLTYLQEAITYNYKVSDLDAGGTMRAEIVSTLGNYVRKDYEAIVAATNVTSADATEDDLGNSSLWVYLPHSLISFSHKEGLTWSWGDYFNGETFVGFYVSDDGDNPLSNATDVASYLQLAFLLKNEYQYEVDWRLVVKIWNEGEGNTISDALQVAYIDSISEGLSFTAATDANATYVNTDIITIDLNEAGGTTTLENIRVAVDFYYKPSTGTQYSSYHMKLTTERFEKYEDEYGHTLYEVVQSIPNYGQPI